MANNNSELSLNALTLRRVIYTSLVIGHLLFISLHPTHFQIGIIGALSFGFFDVVLVEKYYPHSN